MLALVGVARAFGVFNLLASSPSGGSVFRTALAFLVLAIIAAVFGTGSIVPPATGIATLLFYLFLAGFVVALLLGLITGRKTAS
jgi:uncharacterized membrane protein YtjA (UPF0391 family)